jgi:single-strand DNA-binding protein
MNDITCTVIGNLVSDVSLRFTKNGDPVASFRIASNSRRFDKASERWVDGESHFFQVSCFRSLATNAVESCFKGMPIIVTGRLRTHEREQPCGTENHVVRYVDIDANTIGPDLSRGTAVFTRAKRDAVAAAEERLVEDLLAGASTAA